MTTQDYGVATAETADSFTLDGWEDGLIEHLRDEAGEAGDLAQVAICERALSGDAGARVECSRVIAAARAAAGMKVPSRWPL